MTREAIRQLRILVNKVQAPHRKEANLFYNKFKFKNFLSKHGIRVPETYFYFTDPDENLEPVRELESFCVKPCSASSGTDVYILRKEGPGTYREIDGRIHPWSFVEGKCRQIMSIKRSGGVLIEEVIESSPEAAIFVPTGVTGLPDYRCFTLDNKLLYAKLRLPCAKSEGYSNTHRGATALFISSEGIITKDNVFTNTTTIYGKTDLNGVRIPYWDRLKEEVERIASLFKLRFHSVDVVLDKSMRIVCIESEAIPFLGFLHDGAAMDLVKAIQTNPV